MNNISLLRNLANRFPVLKNILLDYAPSIVRQKINGVEGSFSARYCYSVWMRHLVMCHKNGLNSNPAVIAELGPGNSLGIGLAALLSGADEYYALDAVKHTCTEKNYQILTELIELFQNKEQIPDDKEFPLTGPRLDSYGFPDHILTTERLNKSLNIVRLENIKKAISDLDCKTSNEIKIAYYVPWNAENVIRENSVDLIYSQAVLEHVNELEFTYKAMFRWLKSRGGISHQIDFKSHGTAKEWNGHWTHSDFIWNLMKRNKPYLINREPYSKHIQYLQDSRFKIVCVVPVKTKSNLNKNKLTPKFQSLSDEDLNTSEVFIQAIKKNEL
jgi:hypothetical protein